MVKHLFVLTVCSGPISYPICEKRTAITALFLTNYINYWQIELFSNRVLNAFVVFVELIAGLINITIHVIHNFCRFYPHFISSFPYLHHWFVCVCVCVFFTFLLISSLRQDRASCRFQLPLWVAEFKFLIFLHLFFVMWIVLCMNPRTDASALYCWSNV